MTRIFELMFGISLLITAGMLFYFIIKSLTRDKDDYSDCEV